MHFFLQVSLLSNKEINFFFSLYFQQKNSPVGRLEHYANVPKKTQKIERPT